MMRIRAEFVAQGAQTIRYFITAGSVMVLYLGVYTVSVLLGMQYMLAILGAQIVAIGVAFPLYRTFVFKSKGRVTTDFLKFLSVWATGAVAGVVVTPILVEFVKIEPILAQLIAIVLVGVGSFLAHKFFSFSQRAASSGDFAETRDKE